MISIFEQISSSIYPTQLSVGSIIVMLFSLTLAVFFLWPLKRSSATRNMGLAYLFLALFHFTYFIAFTVYHPLAAFQRWLNVPVIIASEIHLTALLLQYPDNRNMKLSRIIMLAQYAGLALAVYIFYSMAVNAGILFKFDGHYYDTGSIMARRFMGQVTMVYSTIFFAAFVFRFFQLRGEELRRLVLIGISCILGATLPAILYILNLKGGISREIFQIMLNMCHLFSWLFVALLHLNTTREKFTFTLKIVGVSLVSFFAGFLLLSHVMLFEMDRNFDTMRIKDSLLHMERPEPGDGVIYESEYVFDRSRPERRGHDRAGTGDRCFNTFAYEEIKKIPDENFDMGLEELLSRGGKFFTGYRKFILAAAERIPPGSTGRGKLIVRELDHVLSYTLYHYSYILFLNDENFREQLVQTLEGADEQFRCFSDEMIAFAESSSLKGSELKFQTVRFIEPMYPSDSRNYLTDSSGNQIISYIMYDPAAKSVRETGFAYLLYREYMYDAALQMILTVLLVTFFIVAVFPFFFFGTIYRPLNSLLKGVNRVINGELDFRITVRSEDEIGEISRTFNIMTERLKDNREEIVRHAKRFRELADLLPDIIYETDVDLDITYMNRAGFILSGYSEDDIRERLSLSELLNESDFHSIKTFSETSGDGKDAVFNMMHDIRKKDGGVFTGENRAVFIYNEDGISGLRGIIRDVTEKLKTEESLRQMQKMETIGTLVAGLAHDFNNILAGITGPLSMISYGMEKQGSIDDDDFRMYLDTMKESSRRAIDLVQQLVNLSRKDSIRLGKIDLRKAFDHVIRICSSTFDKNIEIVSLIPDHPLMIMGDTTQIEQMLLNLCINGSHAMTIMRREGERPGGRLLLEVKKIFADEHFTALHPEAKESSYWMLSVSDTGVGMDSDTMSKLFIPFFTTKDRGAGTGLGLAMVYNIVKHHRGFINVYSEPGVGTTFNVFLPLSEVQEQPAVAPAGPRILSGNELILVADDEESIRFTTRMMLEECGYKVLTAVNGADAVKIYAEHAAQIKLVILDLLMPGMSGDKAAMELKKINPEVKIILSSGMIHDERASRLVSDSKFVFMQKPYTFEALSRAVYDLDDNIKKQAD